ncbi:thiol:disulfide interchange protein DsbA [Alteromonadaceae bacterium 2753L.S.0a.02]|nr:thiol:disulfide interchange protein DsbA [Alteromonadaceae bacterium 2753L.S.0a.02]
MRQLAVLFALILFLGACSQQDANSESALPTLVSKAEAAEAPAEKAPSSNFVEVQYQEGTHYTELDKPIKTLTGDKIEVTEFFSYGCIHCFHFETAAKFWKANLKPDDVEFVQNPAVFNKSWEHYARAFFTAKALGILDKAHSVIFNTIHVDHKRLGTQEEMAKLFETFGVDKATFDKTFTSFGVTSQVQLADKRARESGLRGTPELLVNGRYKITTQGAGGHNEMFLVANFLIEKIRREGK